MARRRRTRRSGRRSGSTTKILGLPWYVVAFAAIGVFYFTRKSVGHAATSANLLTAGD